MIFVYEATDGQIVEVSLSDKERRRREKKGRIKLDDGRTAKRRLDLEHGGMQASTDHWRREQDNWAIAVTPEQIPEAKATAASLGVPTEYNRDGSPQFKSNKHRREFLNKMGFVDRSAWN
jgi:hypothetical protein